VRVRAGGIEQTLRLTAETVAEDSLQIRAPRLRGRRSSGTGNFGLVLEELVPHGSTVRKAEKVAAFNRDSMLDRLDYYRAARIDRELRLKTLRAELNVKRLASRQQIRKARARMDQAALDLKTAPAHSAIQVALFTLDFQEARAEYKALQSEARHFEASQRAEIRLAQLELSEARVEERRAQSNVDKMVVRAPIDGIVVISEMFRGSEIGQIQLGDQLHRGQPYMRIVNPQSIVIAANANQVDIDRLNIGDRARVHFDAYPGLNVPAHVYSIGPLAESHGWRSSYVSIVPVFLRLERSDPKLTPHLTASADIVLRREQCQGIVPREAVFPSGGRGPAFAYARSGAGWEKRVLQLGMANHVEVSVLSGLSEGEVIAVREPVA
jgi:multidrug efflux pump subunit AcrA (membrane-fusion protein)